VTVFMALRPRRPAGAKPRTKACECVHPDYCAIILSDSWMFTCFFTNLGMYVNVNVSTTNASTVHDTGDTALAAQ